MDLMHNQVFRLLDSDRPSAYAGGIYRVIDDDKSAGKTVAVRIDAPSKPKGIRGGRKQLATPKIKRKKSPPPLVGQLLWMERGELDRMHAANLLYVVEVDREPIYYKALESKTDKKLYQRRVLAMSRFLDLEHLQESITVNAGLSALVEEAMTKANVSRGYVYKQWSTLCRLGISEVSLRPRLDRCGAPTVRRPCDPGGRKKAGKKTKVQRVARDCGVELPPKQPGMSTVWRDAIIAADLSIKSKVTASMPKRYIRIIESAFVRRYKCQDGVMVPIDPAEGDYPNLQQVRRVLNTEYPKLMQLLKGTTSGHFNRSLRGLVARSWKRVSGPGHTWAIDSTIGDIYLRSSVNRAWIIGRPVVYVIVDVWSTAVVGFYVCLTGPSWNTAKVSLFNAAADPALVGDLWGYEAISTLYPLPTMCYRLMCDRGEFLSKGASQTAIQLIPCMSYAPPYRPDLKGPVEVLHRIEKDAQFLFVPGAMDFRRAEFDLRKSHPEESALTVREYMQYLHVIFTNYNLTADRSLRVDAHMAAAGVFPSPAGLWRWGHAMGVGVGRAMSQADLVTSLLVPDTATVGRSSVIFAGNDYQSKVVQAEQWTAHARNFNSWKIPVHYYPGSVSRIWTPNTNELGLLELQISDQARASAELTFDEVADATVYQQMQRGAIQHQRTMLGLQALRSVNDIIENAKRKTAEAIQRTQGVQPTMTEARIMELAASAGQAGRASEIKVTEQLRDEALTTHEEMMRNVLNSAYEGDDDHV